MPSDQEHFADYGFYSYICSRTKNQSLMQLRNISVLLLGAVLCLSAAAQEAKPLQLTPDTKFVGIPDYPGYISDIDDGAWTVGANNAYAFFNLDGQCIFGFEWKSVRKPRMLEGAVVMFGKEYSGYGDGQQYILYIDGSVKELPAEWCVEATDFVDGVAVIGKKTGFNKEYFYINTKGERVYGDLTTKTAQFMGKNNALPPLTDGMRAWNDPASSWGAKWGFIDADGKVVIQPRFKDCRPFSEGLALVNEEGAVFFIDKKGQKAFEPKWDTNDIHNISDVHDGIIAVKSGWNAVSYYDTKGELLLETKESSWYYGGYAFFNGDDYYSAGVTWIMDKSMNKVGFLDSFNVQWDYNSHTPCFSGAGVATVGGKRVISPNGTVLIQHYGLDGNRPNDYLIEDFSPSGYAKAELRHNGDKYYGFINLEGEFVIVYDWNRNVKEITRDENNPWRPRKPREPDPIGDPKPPFPIPIDPVKGDPIGPRSTVRQEYNVIVRAEPAEGGSASGGGKYFMGDRVSLKATANENWKFTGFKCETQGAQIGESGDFTIEGKDVSVVAMFVKKDDIEEVSNTGAFSAHQDISINDGEYHLVYDAYMEMSAGGDIDSPYGKNTYGFFSCMLDGDEVITVKQKVNGKESTLSVKMFFVPMKISGIIKDGQKRYLVLDGGQWLFSGITLGQEDPLAALFIEMMMGHRTFGSVSRGRYRIELTQFDAATGECTFGDLERFHPQNGWMLADDYPTTRRSSGFMTVNEDVSIPGELLKGLHMVPGARREVQWTPPKSWAEDNYDALAKDLLMKMGSLQTDWDVTF